MIVVLTLCVHISQHLINRFILSFHVPRVNTNKLCRDNDLCILNGSVNSLIAKDTALCLLSTIVSKYFLGFINFYHIKKYLKKNG